MDEDMQNLTDNEAVRIHSGFPNPALDRLSRGRRLTLDMNQLLIRHPSSTFLFRVSGHQWSQEGVYDGDIAIIDRALQARPQDLVIAWQDSGFVICRANRLLPPEEAWGAVTAVIHQQGIHTVSGN